MSLFKLLMGLCILGACTSLEDLPRVLIISLDGFRYDYPRKAHAFGLKTPNFDRLIAEGVSISDPGLTNAFITKTLPNHYTLVTGLYIESHGIVANKFFDPVFNETFTWSSSLNIKWWNGTDDQKVEPIWITNEASNGKCRSSGVYFWPGGDVIGQRPKYFRSSYNSPEVPFQSRVDTMIEWFTQASEPISFGALYMNEPDSTGHMYGPDSRQVAETVVQMDTHIGQLINKLESKKLFDSMNFILMSDHGMQYVNQSNTIYLDDHIDPSLFRSFAGSPIMHILPNSGYDEEVYRKLSQIKNVTVYKKDEIPAEFHYSKNRRITPIVISVPLGYEICHTKSYCGWSAGNHGWDNKQAVMHPIFIARGPAFKTNYVAEPFETVNVYSLLCHLLGIDPRPNNGTIENVRHILKSDWVSPICSSCGSSGSFGSFLLVTVTALFMQYSW